MKKRKIKILICDDDKYFRMALKELISDHGLIFEAESEDTAQELIKTEYFDLALIDMDIDGPRSGISILKQTKQKSIHSIVLSSQADESIIEEAYENGCDHFLSKSQYRNHLEPYIHSYKTNILNNNLTNFFESKYITHDPDLKSNIEKLCKMNLKDKSVFITGETGVGKSLIGELLHNQTYPKDKPYIHLNCAEIPESLIESELFGHEKGSFTGANNKKIGKLELADGGTLFLDEIGTMPKTMQQKLLKALDQKTFYPVGAEKPTTVDFTLITATCEDIFDKILKDEFRKDLFFRISGLNLEITPLRERKNDIPSLIKYFLKTSHRKFIIKDDAIAEFLKYSWPGNIRELKKKIDVLSTNDKGIIRAGDINFSNLITSQENLLTPNQKEFIAKNGLRDFIKKVEEDSLQQTLKKNQGKITQTIKELKISASAFYRIFDSLKIPQ